MSLSLAEIRVLTTPEEKQCYIVNGYANWQLHVDGEEITFEGGYSAEYFKRHYEALGYDVHLMKTRMYAYNEGGSGQGI